MVVIEMENGKKIKIELYPEIAPITCANFEKLVKEGFYCLLYTSDAADEL